MGILVVNLMFWSQNPKEEATSERQLIFLIEGKHTLSWFVTFDNSSSGDECSIGSATDLTESSSMVDGDWTMVDENFSTLSLTQSELEHISMELASKGPHKSQVQLR